MALPTGFDIPQHIQDQFPNHKLVCKLFKSLYGLKQAPRQWFIALSTALLSFDFLHTCGDPSLFVFSQDSSVIYLLIYVDDMVMTGNNPSLMAQVTDFLSTQFKIKDLGSLHYFLGIQVQHTAEGILMHHSKYTTDILRDFSYL